MNVAPLAQARLGDLTLDLWPRAPYAVHDGGGPGVIGFAFEAQEGQDAIASDRVRSFRRRTNTLAWIPPGCGVLSISRVGGEYLVVRGFTAEAVGHADAAVRAVNDAVDPVAVMAARTLRRLLLSRKTDLEAVSEPVDVLCATLLRRLGGWVDPAAGWLTPARLALAERLVAERTGEPIGVADIATALELSANFLTLAFKGALGMTPHRWLVERRLACARVELAESAKAVAVIAAECGFADQAHLTRQTRETLGVTPAAFRRLRRG